MKVGFIFECGPDGADKQVCECLAARVAADKSVAVTFESVTLDNKPSLIAGCGAAAQTLLASGCEKVLIIWDLYPAWRDDGGRPCRKADRDQILASLNEASVGVANVHLICIAEELEAWLIADGKNIEAVLSTLAHACTGISNKSKPDSVRNPKTALSEHFRQNPQRGFGRRYVDRDHAILLAKGASLDRVRKSVSFSRFEAKLDL